MIDIWYKFIDLFPFAWTNYEFMQNALLSVVIITPCFGLIGTMVVGNRMAFFSDVIGHSALTGVAIGVILGLADVRPAMIIFAVILSLAVNIILEKTKASSDTVMGVFASITAALGIALLSRVGSFNKYSIYLIGDILSVTTDDIFYIGILFVSIILFWIFFGNYLALMSVEPALVYGRFISPFIIRTFFSTLVALIVILSIKWVGLLIINSLFILPAASARLISRSLREYCLRSILISIISGICGLIISFYAGSTCGATIVICAAFIYLSIIMFKSFSRSLSNY
ncbi:MAG: metal ABC transporter permease [Leptospirales bacterium]|nr:metal ABC transporter permease [Leptospirales bacterium]